MKFVRQSQSPFDDAYSYNLYMFVAIVFFVLFFSCWYRTPNCLKVVCYLVYPSREFGTCTAMPTKLPRCGECENDYRKITLSFDLCIQFLFLFGSALAAKPQLPFSSDIFGSVIYVTPLPSSKIQNTHFIKASGAFPDSILSLDTLLISQADWDSS